MVKRLSECITYVDTLYKFDYVKFSGSDPGPMILKHYTNDVETFLNTRNNLHRCPGCDRIDSESNISACVPHDQDKCLRYHVVNYVWRNIGFFGRMIPQSYSYTIKKLYKEGSDWVYRRESKTYSILIMSYGQGLIEDWKIPHYIPKDECTLDFKVIVEQTMKLQQNKLYS
jgi:hypothetical protein